MAISKFGIMCIAAALTGGATAVLAGSGSGSPQPVAAPRTTALSAIAHPERSFRAVAVRSETGLRIGHVVAIATDGAGHAARVHVALDGTSRTIWFDQAALSYSRADDVIIAHDIRPLAVTVADAR